MQHRRMRNVPLTTENVLECFDAWLQQEDKSGTHPDSFRAHVDEITLYLQHCCCNPSLLTPHEEPHSATTTTGDGVLLRGETAEGTADVGSAKLSPELLDLRVANGATCEAYFGLVLKTLCNSGKESSGSYLNIRGM